MRGLAVAGVLLYHGGVGWLPGGYLGVDAFFVLSGYLITSLLVAEWRSTGTISLRAFWARRARRLLPALFGVLAGVLVYAAVTMPSTDLGALRGDAVATLLYVANWRAVLSGHAYMDQFAAPSLLMHTWSLAVEEQWYLLWPPVAFAALRHGGTRLLAFLAAGGYLASVVSASVLSHGAFTRAYYGTDTRAQSLLLGALVALAVPALPRVRSRVAQAGFDMFGIAGALAAGWFWATTRTNAPDLFDGPLLVAALGTAGVIVTVVTVRDGLLAWILSWKPLRALGLISYGLYLWHWPVFLVVDHARTGLEGSALLGVRCAVSLLIATASFLFIEKPIRAGALARTGPVVRRAVAPVMVGALVVLIALVTSGATSTPSLEAIAARVHRRHPAVPATQPVPQPATGARPVRVAPRPLRVLIVGDSTALMVGAGFAPTDQTGLWIDDQGVLGCGLLNDGPRLGGDGTWSRPPARCNAMPALWRNFVATDRPDEVVLLVGPWDIEDRRVAGRVVVPGDHEYTDELQTALDDGVRIWSALGARVVILTSPHLHPREDARGDATADPHRIDALNSIERAYAAAHPSTTTLLDWGPWLDAQEAAGAHVRPDGVHLGLFTAHIAGDWLTPRLRALSPGVDTAAPEAVAHGVHVR
ncbi:MAG TPA: acyltransferase family protein [Acidimicrobiia bacterium]